MNGRSDSVGNSHQPRASESYRGQAESAPAVVPAKPSGATLEDVPGYRRPPATAVAGRLVSSLARDAASGSLSNRPTGMLPEVVIGRDDRIRVPNVGEYPWRAICALQITA